MGSLEIHVTSNVQQMAIFSTTPKQETHMFETILETVHVEPGLMRDTGVLARCLATPYKLTHCVSSLAWQERGNFRRMILLSARVPDS